MVARSAYAQLHYSPFAARRHGSCDAAGLCTCRRCAALLAHGAAREAGFRDLGDDDDHVRADADVLWPIAALGRRSASHCARLCRLHDRFRLAARCAAAAACGKAEFRRPGFHDRSRRRSAPSKGHTDENFPVASMLVSPRHRATILAFYRFARAADDIADQPEPRAGGKTARARRTRGDFARQADSAADALAAARWRSRRKTSTARHALDLLVAFRRDVTKKRYEDWDDLIDYCRYSAMPVGRFVLDVHGENPPTSGRRTTRSVRRFRSSTICRTARKDYREIDRVYVPLDALAAAGADVSALAAPAASPALLRAIAGRRSRTRSCCKGARDFAAPFRISVSA